MDKKEIIRRLKNVENVTMNTIISVTIQEEELKKTSKNLHDTLEYIRKILHEVENEEEI